MVLVLAGLWVGQNVNLLPVDASVNAPVYDELFKVLFSIGTILFIGIVGLIVYSLVRFRRRQGDSTDGEAVRGQPAARDPLDRHPRCGGAVRGDLQLRHL